MGIIVRFRCSVVLLFVLTSFMSHKVVSFCSALISKWGYVYSYCEIQATLLRLELCLWRHQFNTLTLGNFRYVCCHFNLLLNYACTFKRWSNLEKVRFQTFSLTESQQHQFNSKMKYPNMSNLNGDSQHNNLAAYIFECYTYRVSMISYSSQGAFWVIIASSVHFSWTKYLCKYTLDTLCIDLVIACTF